MDWTLLANSEAYSLAGRYMKQSGPSGDLFYVYLTIFGVILFWVSMFLWERYRHRLVVKRPQTPKSIFTELAAAHKLSRTEKSLIRKAAGHEADLEAAMCFVDPTNLARKIDQNSEQSQQYEKLHKQLFGG